MPFKEKRKSRRPKTHHFLQDIAANVNIVGLEKVGHPDVSLPRKIIWAILIIAALGFTCYQIWNKITLFARSPTLRTYRYTQEKELTLPAISVCVSKMIVSSEYLKLADEFEMYKNKSILLWKQRLMDILSDDFVRECTWLFGKQHNRCGEYLTIARINYDITADKTGPLHAGKFSPDEWVARSLVCQTINDNGTMKAKDTIDKIIIKIHRKQSYISSTLYLNSPGERQFSVERLLTSSTEDTVYYIQKTSNRDFQKKACSEKNSQYQHETDCMLDCTVVETLKATGCFNPFDPLYLNPDVQRVYPVCNNKMKVLHNYMTNIKQKQCSKKCSGNILCEKDEYSVVKVLEGHLSPYRLKLHTDRNSIGINHTMWKKFLKSSSANDTTVYFKFNSMGVTTTEYRNRITVDGLLSDFGGIFALMLGIRILTFCQLFDFLLVTMYEGCFGEKSDHSRTVVGKKVEGQRVAEYYTSTTVGTNTSVAENGEHHQQNYKPLFWEAQKAK